VSELCGSSNPVTPVLANRESPKDTCAIVPLNEINECRDGEYENGSPSSVEEDPWLKYQDQLVQFTKRVRHR
jgi:hypothetical protein